MILVTFHLEAAFPVGGELQGSRLQSAHPEGEDVDGGGKGHRVLCVQG